MEQVEKVGGVGQEEGRVALEKHLKLLARDIRLQQVHLVFALLFWILRLVHVCVTLNEYTKLILVATRELKTRKLKRQF